MGLPTEEKTIRQTITSSSKNGRPIQGFWFGLLVGLFVGGIFLFSGSEIHEWVMALRLKHDLRIQSIESTKPLSQGERYRLQVLRNRLDALIPNEPYLIINTIHNRFLLKRKRRILHEGICSTGSYTLLQTHDGEETWLFKTPRGMFRVRHVLKNPVWRMPDWAFIEEGRPVPPPDSPKRFEYGVLGDYAFDLGNGYLIHGTLYQRFLGMPVTHGCIRLGDEDLMMVYRHLQVGSKVFIY